MLVDEYSGVSAMWARQQKGNFLKHLDDNLRYDEPPFDPHGHHARAEVVDGWFEDY